MILRILHHIIQKTYVYVYTYLLEYREDLVRIDTPSETRKAQQTRRWIEVEIVMGTVMLDHKILVCSSTIYT